MKRSVFNIGEKIAFSSIILGIVVIIHWAITSYNCNVNWNPYQCILFGLFLIIMLILVIKVWR